MKVQQFYNKNQFVITDHESGKTVFQSYDSTIAQIDRDGVLTLGADWDYSHTTLKHFYFFLSDYRYTIKCTSEQYNELFRNKGGVFNAKNKRAFMQDLINKGVIKVVL